MNSIYNSDSLIQNQNKVFQINRNFFFKYETMNLKKKVLCLNCDINAIQRYFVPSRNTHQLIVSYANEEQKIHLFLQDKEPYLKKKVLFLKRVVSNEYNTVNKRSLRNIYLLFIIVSLLLQNLQFCNPGYGYKYRKTKQMLNTF